MDRAQDSNLAHLLGDLSQSEKLSKIKLPLDLGYAASQELYSSFQAWSLDQSLASVFRPRSMCRKFKPINSRQK